MVIFKNTNRRGRFRSKDRNFKRNGDVSKFKSDFSTNSNFQRKHQEEIIIMPLN